MNPDRAYVMFARIMSADGFAHDSALGLGDLQQSVRQRREGAAALPPFRPELNPATFTLTG